MTDKKQYSLFEAIADIAFIAGRKDYYGGDSRGDNSTFIELAKEFEDKFSDVEWGFEMDYVDEITKFANEKLTQKDS